MGAISDFGITRRRLCWLISLPVGEGLVMRRLRISRKTSGRLIGNAGCSSSGSTLVNGRKRSGDFATSTTSPSPS